MSISASPLTWPEGWPRTPSWQRGHSKFSSRGKSLSVAEAVGRVREQLKLMGIKDDDIIVSTNLRLRLDGLPRSDQPEPSDSGAAVYWETKKGNKVLAIDRYYRVADNLAAIAATLDAMRAIERHGGAEILASGGWTRVEDGLPVVPDGLDHVEIFFFCAQDSERRVGRRLWLDVDAALSHGITHWRYAEPTPEPPKG